MAETDISVATVIVRAELAEFKKSMATMGPEAAAAAADMTRAIQKELKAIEAAQKSTTKVIATEHKKAATEVTNAAKTATKSWGDVARAMNQNQLISQAETVSALFIQVGGAVSQVASTTTSLIRPLAIVGEKLGPNSLLALGVAALPVGLLAIKGAFSAVANSAVSAEQELKKLGLLTDAKASRTLREYEFATRDVSIAWAELKVIIGEQAAPALVTLANATAAGVRAFTEFYNLLAPAREAAQTFARVGLFAVTAGLSEMALAAVNAAAANNDLSGSYEEVHAKINKLHDAYIKKISTDAEYARITALLIEEDNRLQDELDVQLVKESEVKAAKEAKAQAARAAAIAEAAHTAKVREYIAAVEQQKALDLAGAESKVALAKANEDAIEAERQAYLSWYSERQSLNRQIIADEEDKAKQLKSIALSIADSTLGSVNSVTDGIIASYQRRQEEGEKLTEQQKQAALAAFAIGQAAAIAQATIAAVQIGLNTMNSLTAVFVPFPAALAAGIAATGTVLAGQVAAIASQPPPEFPMGMTPDHEVVGKRRSEGITTDRAMRELDRVMGPGGHDRLNSGEPLALGGGESTKILVEIRDLLKPARGPTVISASIRRGKR